MAHNPLRVITTAPKEIKVSSPLSTKEMIKAKCDRHWLKAPISLSEKEQERVSQIFGFIQKHVSLNGLKAVDLGCGRGELSLHLRNAGCVLDAVDASHYPLKVLQREQNIRPLQDCLPNTKLEDNGYDLVVATNVLAELDDNQHRLFFSELARLVKLTGFVVCSTPLDIDSVDALEKFHKLASTEFEFIDWQLSYQGMQIRLERSLAKWWKGSPSFFSKRFALLEKFALKRDLSHATFIGKLRPLF